MKKIRSLILTLVLVVIAAVPMLVGCTEKTPTLEVSEDFKTEYLIGEQLNTTGGVLLYTDKTGKENFVSMEEATVTAFSTETVGTRKMIISYEDLTIVYSYTVSPVFAEIGVPYCLQTSTGDNPTWSVVIFNSDNTVSMWITTIAPTLSNASSLFNGSNEAATLVSKVAYAKEVVEDKYYLVSFNSTVQGMSVSIPTTAKILNSNSILISQELQAGQPAYTATLTKVN